MDPVFMKGGEMRPTGPWNGICPRAARPFIGRRRAWEAAKRNERKINPDDLITLRRVGVTSPCKLSFQRGAG